MRLDRLGRRILERVRCREELKTLGVPVHSVREGGEVSDLVANILASVAEEESAPSGSGSPPRSATSRRAVGTCAGGCPGDTGGGRRPRRSAVTGAPAKVLDVDPQTMPYVQEAFARAAGGETLHAVHRWVAGLPARRAAGAPCTTRPSGAC